MPMGTWRARPALMGTRSVRVCVPTRSVGTREEGERGDGSVDAPASEKGRPWILREGGGIPCPWASRVLGRPLWGRGASGCASPPRPHPFLVPTLRVGTDPPTLLRQRRAGRGFCEGVRVVPCQWGPGILGRPFWGRGASGCASPRGAWGRIGRRSCVREGRALESAGGWGHSLPVGFADAGPALMGTRSVRVCVPTRSVGTREEGGVGTDRWTLLRQRRAGMGFCAELRNRHLPCGLRGCSAGPYGDAERPDVRPHAQRRDERGRGRGDGSMDAPASEKGRHGVLRERAGRSLPVGACHLRPALMGTRSVRVCVPTRSVGTREERGVRTREEGSVGAVPCLQASWVLGQPLLGRGASGRASPRGA